MNTPAWVQEVLSRFENRIDSFEELEIAESLSATRKDQGDLNDENWQGFLAEWSAFQLYARREKDGPWNTYFSPMFTSKKQDGSDFFSPDIRNLNAQCVVHWEARAQQQLNPVMRARYADLVWDMKSAVTQEKPSADFARIAIDSYLEANDGQFYVHEMTAIERSGRALDLSLSINDSSRLARVVESAFELYDRIAKPRFIGTWLFLFDDLYGEEFISADQENRIVTNLESMLATSIDGTKSDAGAYENLDPWAAEAAATRLAKHYRRQNEKSNVERVMRSYGKAFEQMARGAAPMLATAWLQPVIERFEQEGMKPEAEYLQSIARDKGKNISSDLKTVSVQTKIKKEVLDELVERLIGNGDIKISLGRMASYFVPKVEDIRKLLEEMRTKAPLTSMISINIVEREGFTTATVGSLDDDFEGRLHQQLARYIGINQMFLEYVFARFRERYEPSVEDLLDFLSESPVFVDHKDGLLRDGIEAYHAEDFVKSTHVLVPQAEHLLRNFVDRMGIPTRKFPRNQPGVSDAKNMNDLLADARVREVLTEDLWRYLAVFYVDRRGLNFRNDLAHGLVPRAAFTRSMGDRVLHTLLALSLIRTPQEEEASA